MGKLVLQLGQVENSSTCPKLEKKLLSYPAHTQFTEESKMATTLTPQTDVTSGKPTENKID